jgi:4,5-DOPA dioxygenase extradiol
MTATPKAPVLFISHGSPTFAVEPGLLGPQLASVGKQLPALKAVLVVSPHWQTKDLKVMGTARPETVHDFAGFPSSLYALRYPVAGEPVLANEAQRLLKAAGFATTRDDRRGLDHGAWVPLLHLLPDAKVPVFQVSMPFDLTTHTAVKVGQALAPLRDQGVLIVASGSMTHNLHDFRHAGAQPEAYAQEFAAWVDVAVRAKGLRQLLDYRTEAPHAVRAHPSEEHYLPLLIAMGATNDQDALSALQGGVSNGAVSMDSYLWG